MCYKIEDIIWLFLLFGYVQRCILFWWYLWWMPFLAYNPFLYDQFLWKNFTSLHDHVSASLLIYFFFFWERKILKLCELNFINTYNSQWFTGFNITFSFCCFRGVITYTLHFTWFRFPLGQSFSDCVLTSHN